MSSLITAITMISSSCSHEIRSAHRVPWMQGNCSGPHRCDAEDVGGPSRIRESYPSHTRHAGWCILLQSSPLPREGRRRRCTATHPLAPRRIHHLSTRAPAPQHKFIRILKKRFFQKIWPPRRTRHPSTRAPAPQNTFIRIKKKRGFSKKGF